jgi:hypothetical protein
MREAEAHARRAADQLADSGAALRRFQERFSDPRNLRHWHELEQKYPETFSRMYQFWVR